MLTQNEKHFASIYLQALQNSEEMAVELTVFATVAAMVTRLILLLIGACV